MPATPSSERSAVETSVSFSLEELSRLEHERVREEQLAQARLREARALEERAEQERRRAAEEQRIAAAAQARAGRQREEAEEKARSEARALAAMEVARIEAEAKARLEADNALRAHELVVLRARRERGGRTVQRVLAGALALAVCGGSASAYAVNRQLTALEQEAERLRERQASLVREREQLVGGELALLDRRFAALRGRAGAGATDETRAAEVVRNQLDAAAVDRGRLRAFADALDMLAVRLDLDERVAHLDRRHADLAAWAAKQRRGEVMTPVSGAAMRARAAAADEAALRAYDSALSRARAALANESAPGPRTEGGKVVGAQARCTNPHDPLCGLDGQPLLR
jgi:hypothetical protein